MFLGLGEIWMSGLRVKLRQLVIHYQQRGTPIYSFCKIHPFHEKKIKHATNHDHRNH